MSGSIQSGSIRITGCGGQISANSWTKKREVSISRDPFVIGAQPLPEEVRMSHQPISYPADAGAATYLLTVRGKVAAPDVAGVRELHNATAGSPEGVAAARALGDLSHNVYSAAGDGGADEILFLDHWNSLTGFGQFFSDPQVQAGAGQLFAERDGAIWGATSGFGDFHLALPSGRSTPGVGMLRARVSSLEAAAAGFTAYAGATINIARRYGLASHSVWSRIANPGETVAPEIVGVDVWTDLEQMAEFYALRIGYEHLGPVFAGEPQTSVWQSAAGDWVEW
jgi:hypothetical protein